MKYYTALELQKKRQRKKRTQAAKRIQRWWRPYAEAFAEANRQLFIIHTRAATQIQRAFRCRFLKRRLTNDLKFLVWLKCRRRLVLAKFRRISWGCVWRIRSSVKILQKNLRLWWRRFAHHRSQQRKAAISIQKLWRSHRLHKMQAPLRLWEESMMMLLRDEVLNRRLLQKTLLGKLVIHYFQKADRDAQKRRVDQSHTIPQPGLKVLVPSPPPKTRGLGEGQHSWGAADDQLGFGSAVEEVRTASGANSADKKSWRVRECRPGNSAEFGHYSTARSLSDCENTVKPHLSQRHPLSPTTGPPRFYIVPAVKVWHMDRGRQVPTKRGIPRTDDDDARNEVIVPRAGGSQQVSLMGTRLIAHN